MGYRILFCHGLGSSVRNRISQQLTKLFAGTEHHFEPVQYPPGNPCWRVKQWQAAIEQRLRPEGGNIVVAQSAGAQPVLNAAVKHPAKIDGLFLISPGYDVDFSYVDKAIPGAHERLLKGESLPHPATRNGDVALVDLHSFQEFYDNDLSRTTGELPITCPVTVVHGTSDTLVPYGNSIRLLMRLASKDIHMRDIPGGTHYLSMDDEIVREEFERFCLKMGLFPAKEEEKRSLRAKA